MSLPSSASLIINGLVSSLLVQNCYFFAKEIVIHDHILTGN